MLKGPILSPEGSARISHVVTNVLKTHVDWKENISKAHKMFMTIQLPQISGGDNEAYCCI